MLQENKRRLMSVDGIKIYSVSSLTLSDKKDFSRQLHLVMKMLLLLLVDLLKKETSKNKKTVKRRI